MACSICETSSTFVTVTYRICESCYEGANNIIKLINKPETENENAKSSATPSHTSSFKSLANALKWVVRLTEKLSFLHGFVDAYKNRTPSDVLLKPGSNGHAIAAHRAILAARSTIFKNMLEADASKVIQSKTIKLPELNQEELEAFLEFLYSGNLPREKLEKHIYSLAVAAEKYEVVYLLNLCQNYMVESLDSRNALLFCEISDSCSFITIRDYTLRFIAKHVEDIVFSAEYEAFAVKNPRLSMLITRALSRTAKNNGVYAKDIGTCRLRL